jgi:hypothetical protein
MLYASAADTLAKRSIGSTGNVLTVVGGVPTWAAPATSGTVTNVSTVTTGMGLTLAVTNPTTTPTLTLAGTLLPAKGGTGIDASGSTGVLVFLGGSASVRNISNGDIDNAAGIARSKLATGTAYRVLANGASGAVSELASTGTTGQVLTSNGASALPTFQTMVIPYDLAGEAVGALTSGLTVFRFIAPRNITLTALAQGGGATATVKVQVAGSDVTLPGSVSVTSGQIVSVVTTSTGTDAYFTITGVVA